MLRLKSTLYGLEKERCAEALSFLGYSVVQFIDLNYDRTA
jgi:hypothetical protein